MTRWRSAALKLALSLGTASLVVGLLEGGARLAGFGEPGRFGGSILPYQQVFSPLFVEIPGATPPRARPRDPRLVDRSFPLSGTPRVFVLGESAVIGLGGAENDTFARALERDLRAAGLPHSVVNCGIVALDSRQILTIARDVTRFRPEVVVVHVGNNEWLEAHALRYLEHTTGLPFSFRLEEALSGSRLFLGLKQKGIESKTRHLTRATFRYDELRHGETKVAEVRGVVLSAAEVAESVAAHASRLRGIVRLCKAAGSRVVLMTVATNLEWTAPTESPEGELEKVKRDISVRTPRPERVHEGDPTALLGVALDELGTQVDDASREPIDHWRFLVRRGFVKRALGDGRGALADLRRANDEDPHLRRTLTTMNENVRKLATEENVTLVDGEQILAAASKDGITGFEMLYDYVHFTPEGNERLGAALAKALVPGKDAFFDARVESERARLGARKLDALEVEDYFGWNGDRSLLSNKSLWKYDDAHDALAKKVEDGSATGEEIVWTANYHALRVGDEARARGLYAKARAKAPELAPVLDANLRWLDAR